MNITEGKSMRKIKIIIAYLKKLFIKIPVTESYRQIKLKID